MLPMVIVLAAVPAGVAWFTSIVAATPVAATVRLYGVLLLGGANNVLVQGKLYGLWENAFVGGPSHGTLDASSGSGTTVTYTPAGAYIGTDSFTFDATDGTPLEAWWIPAT